MYCHCDFRYFPKIDDQEHGTQGFLALGEIGSIHFITSIEHKKIHLKKIMPSPPSSSPSSK